MEVKFSVRTFLGVVAVLFAVVSLRETGALPYNRSLVSKYKPPQVELEKGEPSELAQMATKGNFEEVVTTRERSWVHASP
nr:hypothetical protein [Tanacetum cinerariifolium]